MVSNEVKPKEREYTAKIAKTEISCNLVKLISVFLVKCNAQSCAMAQNVAHKFVQRQEYILHFCAL